jgi:DNA polymerase-3 subunit delta
MAKGREEAKLNYKQELQKLRIEGPETLYFLWGKEDYLREQYLTQLKAICIPEGESGFNYKRFDGPELSAAAFREAVDAMPFLSDRSFVELRDVDVNKLKEAQDIQGVLSDIPDYCTVCFVQNAEFEPDGRLKLVKLIREKGRELKFTQQGQGALIDWIARRFAAQGKRIDFDAAQRLIFISGDLMNRLIPEIDKIAAYTSGEKVGVAEVEAVAHHIPEEQVFTLTDLLAQKKINSAMNTLAELLAENEYEPIFLLAVLGNQMRRLYAARLAVEQKLGSKYVVECCGIKYDFLASKLMSAARGFTLQQLRDAVALCAETDLQMKSGGGDARELLKNAVLTIAAGVTDAAR